jgi:hypothetical protein
VAGTGFAGVRGTRPRLQVQRWIEALHNPVGAGLPAKQAARWLAPALPVFATQGRSTEAAVGAVLRVSSGGTAFGQPYTGP